MIGVTIQILVDTAGLVISLGIQGFIDGERWDGGD